MNRRLFPLALAVLAALLAIAQGAPASRSQAPAAPAAPGERAWRGQWIWTTGEPSPRNAYVHFRKAFTLDKAPKEARVHLTADSRYQLSDIDGF